MTTQMATAALAGASAPLGASVRPDGVNFSVFSKNATSIELLLFDDVNAIRPAKATPLDPQRHRTHRSGVAAAKRGYSHSLALTLRSLSGRFLLHMMLNAYWEPLTFELPPVPGESQQRWRRCIDTALSSPDDISAWNSAPAVAQSKYVAQPRSIVLLALALQAGKDVARPTR